MRHQFRILVSAYACEPNKGSEPGVGWNWINEIANRGHDVVVLTRENNRGAIEQASYDRAKIRFCYYDLPRPVVNLKKVIGVHLYYALWQIAIIKIARRICHDFHIDAIHHLTFVALRKPVFLHVINKPFFYGPLGGGEEAPLLLLRQVPLKFIIIEIVRSMLNRLIRINVLQLWSFSKAELLSTTTKESLAKLPSFSRRKTVVFPAIGIKANTKSKRSLKKNGRVKLLFVGRFVYWKGLHLIIRSLCKLNASGVQFELTLVGEGSYKGTIKKLIDTCMVNDCVHFRPWATSCDLEKIYSDHDVFVFPSLHDSGGMVVLEALNQGLPVVCLDLGGPGMLVDNDCGVKVDVANKTVNQIVDDLASGIINVSKCGENYQKLSQGALLRVKQFSWENVVSAFYEPLEKKCSEL